MQEREKPSKTRQWQERSESPVASRPMTPQEIIAFMKTLADSYKCDVNEISYDFEKIQDENDTDRDDCLWLMYRMKCVISGKPGTRDIFRIKLPIPDEVRRAGELARQQQAKRGRRNLAIMPASSETSPTGVNTTGVNTTETTLQNIATTTQTVPTETIEHTPTVPVPKVRRPARRK